jgi:hypothetical protein
MSIYTYNGLEFSEEDVIAKAEEKGLDLDSYINEFGIKRKEDKVPGKPKPAVKKGAVAAVKSTVSKSVNTSSEQPGFDIKDPTGVNKAFNNVITPVSKVKTAKPVSIEKPKQDLRLMSKYDSKVKEKEEEEEEEEEDGGFFNYLKESFDSTVSSISQSFYKAPEYAYDFIASNITDPAINAVSEAVGGKKYDNNSDKIMETFGIRNVPAEILQKKINASNKIIKDYSDKNGVDPLTAIENGNYLGAAKLIAGATAQSMPIVIASILSGGSSVAMAGIAASTAVSKSEELKISNPEIDTKTRTNVSAVSGLLEGYLGQFFTGASGRIAQKILVDKGTKAGSKIISNGLIGALEKVIEKNPVVGVLGEVIEESGVDFGNQINEINAGIRKELDYRSIANSGLSSIGMAGTNTVPIYAAKGYMKLKDYNQVKAVNKEINGLTNQLSSPYLSDSDKKLITSRVNRLVDENKAIAGASLEKINALPGNIKSEINTINTDLDDLKSKYLDIADNSDLPIEAKRAMGEELKLQAKELYDRKTSIIEGNYIYDDFRKLPIEEQTRFKDIANQTLIADSELDDNPKTSFNEDEINKEAINIYNAELRTENIIKDIGRTRIAAEKLGLMEQIEIPELKTANDVITYLKNNTNLDKTAREDYSGSLGLFVPLKNGKEALIINQEEAAMESVVTTGQHEFLHKLVYKAVKDNPELQKKIGNDLYNHIEKYIGTEEFNNTEFKERYDGYKLDFDKTKAKVDGIIKSASQSLSQNLISQEQYTESVEKANNIVTAAEGKYLEETLPLLSESLSKGDIKYNETFFTKLGDIIRKVFQKFGLSKVNFETGKDVFDFVRDYNKSFKEGKFTKAFESLAKEGKYKGVIKKETKAVDEAIVKESKATQKPQSELIKEKILAIKENEGDYDPNEYDQEVARLEGELKRAIAKETTTSTVKKEILTEEDEVKEIIKNEKESVASDKVQKIYETKGLNGAQDIIDLFKPITKKIVDKRRDAPGFDRQLLTDEVETGVGGILDLIRTYNPNKGAPLAAYINKQLPLRAIASSKRVLDKQFNKDASEEVGLMATETADQNMVERVAEKPKYKNALESKVLEPEVLKTISNKILTNIRTLKTRIDAPISLNRTVTPLIAEIRDAMGKQLDIDLKTAMGGKKDNQLRNFALKNKKYFLENMTTTFLMGADGKGGVPQAIQKQVDGKWTNYPDWVGKKIDREKTTTDNAGRTSGAELVRRLPNAVNNVSDEDYLGQLLESDGNPIRGRKESWAKAMAEEIAFDVINTDLAEEGPIFEALSENQKRLGVELIDALSTEIARQTERGNIKFSKKITKDALNTLSKNNWDLNNENYKEFISNLSDKEGEYIDNLLRKKSIKQLRLHLNTIELEDKEFEFKEKIISSLKDPVNNVLSKINRFELISKAASTSTSKLNDLKIKYKNNIYNFELKLYNNSRLKGVVINNVTTDPSINKDTGINEIIYQTLKDSENVKAYTDYLLDNGGTLNSNGSIQVPISVFSDKKAKALQEKAKVTISANADFIIKLNNNANDAITFGESGTFSYGNAKFEGILPIIDGDVNFEITTQRGSMDANNNVSVYFIGFPKMAPNWDQKSTVDIYKKPKKLLTIIRKASLLKKNILSAKATKAVLNAVRPSYMATPKKINVVDVDNAFSKVKAKISYKDKAGKVKKINISEFLKQQMQLELDGIIFDYSDLKTEINNNPDIFIVFDKLKNDENFVVTTEPTESNNAIQTLLQNVDVSILLNNINTLYDNSEQSKADWLTSKLSEGFNDFNIANGPFANSDGIKNILDNFDIKSEKQKEQLDFFNFISYNFSKIIYKNAGISPAIVYSDIVARRKGFAKNRFDFYVPPSAADFELLLYKFIGKGSAGEEQKEFFDRALLKPYANGNDLMDAARQSIKREYKELIDTFPGIKKKIESSIPDGDFTYDQAIRVAMWNEEGVEIPGISQRDSKKLTKLVNADPELKAFKEGLIVTGRQGKGWVKPENFWDANTIISDLHNLTEGAGRKKFLAEFIENAELMFGKWDQGRLVGPNINKVEAVYGTNVREAIEDVLWRMTTGKNRGYGKDKETSRWSNWVNGSTGTIMFLNTRSAALQLIGAVNFLNLRDNNPYAAAKAFANQKQYWEDFAHIWNSDKMKERRGGLKEDVAAAEVANAAASSTNKANAVISYLLKVGYTPTQLADSFAIASGGAPYYRNRIKTYLNEGLSEQEAETKAWSDFTKVADETQQSGDPRDISKQQASGAGRLLLTFQNTAMQQSRIVKKSFLDLKNGRGDAKTNVAKIIYYLGVQNVLFAALQQGLIAVGFGFLDDEEDEAKKKALEKEKDKKVFDITNGVIDTILSGTGFVGKVVVTLKNMAKVYLDERDKNFKADYAKVVLEAANISPPIGSKLRKLYSGLQQTKYDKDLIKERGWGVMQDGRVHLGPMYSVAGKVVEAGTNVPLDRLATKIENASQAMNSQNEAWQRVMIGLGFNPYSLGVKETKGDVEIEATAKETRKEEGLIKAKETRERTKDSIRSLPREERRRLKKEDLLKRREKKIKKRKMG